MIITCALSNLGLEREVLQGESMAKIGFKKCYDSSKVVVSILLVQAFTTGLQLLAKVILNDGTFIYALVAYRHVVGAVCVAPLALYFEKSDADLDF